MLDEIKSFLGKDWTDVDNIIRKSLVSDISLLNKTNNSIVDNSGKKIRPMICLLVARACSGGFTTDDSLHFAAAGELLHNATLFHDDVADCSSLRRGSPTVMSLLGGTASVLLGDYWLVKALENILSSQRHALEVVSLFSKTLGDLAEGEMLQLQKARSGDTTESDYYRIIYNKTASLFDSLAVASAVSVGASQEQVAAVKEYATDIGIAFQIKDDIFDYSGTAVIGKPVGIDLDEQKITLPLLGALSKVGKEKDAEIRAKIQGIHEIPEYKDEVRTFVVENGGLEFSEAKLEEFISKAISALRVLPDSKEKSYLVEIAKFIGERNK